MSVDSKSIGEQAAKSCIRYTTPPFYSGCKRKHMKVIILAAGIGKRLGDSSQDLPKCLLKINESSLLERHITLLKQFGLHDICVVTGFQQEIITKELLKFKLDKKSVYNPDYKMGSVISLYCARETLLSGEDIILMDADVLYDPQILLSLLNTKHPNCFLLDRDFEPGEEPVKLCVRDEKLVEFRKKIDSKLEYAFQGESVGFFRFSPGVAKKLVRRLQHYLNNNLLEEPYEEAIRDLLLEDADSFSYEDISGLAWIEIDFPEDLERARTEILNKLETVNN